MSGQNPITIEAKSVEQALVKAAGALGVAQDEVSYEILKENTSKGLFSFFKSPVVEIRAWIKSSRGKNDFNGTSAAPRTNGRHHKKARAHQEASYDHETADESTKAEMLSPEAKAALIAELREFCSGICSKLAGEQVAVEAVEEEGRLVLDVQSEFMAQQITRNSKLAEAMEHILRKKPRHLRQELPFRIFVDASGIRRKREHELIQMARDLSMKVHENKRPIVLNYKSSYDRKIIHMALDKDDRVYTKSIGNGPNRKLMILPTKGEQGAADRGSVEHHV